MNYINAGEPWTDSEKQFLIENYAKLGAIKISVKMGRTPKSVRNCTYMLRRTHTNLSAASFSGRRCMDIQ